MNLVKFSGTKFQLLVYFEFNNSYFFLKDESLIRISKAEEIMHFIIYTGSTI